MRWNFILIVFFSLLMGACASKRQASRGKQTRPTKQSEQRDRETGSRQQDNRSRQQERQAGSNPGASRSLNTEEYIRLYSSVAIEEMNRSGVPASITLAQGILESGNGNSRLARRANNHFGIKCTPDWKGGKTYKDDDRRNDCFRVYASAKESYRDHSQFLKRDRYAFLFNLKPTDYKGWARGLKKAGYATNPRYPQLLISLIERYELHYFDQPRGRKSEKVFANNDTPREEPAESSTANSQVPATSNTPAGTGTASDSPASTGTVSSPDDNTTGGDATAATEPVPAAGSSTAGGTAATAPAVVEQPSTDISTSHYYYTVKPGDTLFAISKRFDITVDELRQWNSLSSNAIANGQRLRVSR